MSICSLDSLVNSTVICQNFRTPKIINFPFEQMENSFFLSVPVFKHVMVIYPE